MKLVHEGSVLAHDSVDLIVLHLDSAVEQFNSCTDQVLKTSHCWVLGVASSEVLEVVSSRETIVLAKTFTVLTQVESLMGFVELFEDIVLRLIDLQLGSVEDVHCLDVSSIDLLRHVVAVLVESLQLTGASHVLDFVTCCEQILSLHQSQV